MSDMVRTIAKVCYVRTELLVIDGEQTDTLVWHPLGFFSGPEGCCVKTEGVVVKKASASVGRDRTDVRGLPGENMSRSFWSPVSALVS